MLYKTSSFLLLRVESCNFFQAEKERIACKDKQILKMTTIFIQNVPKELFIKNRQKQYIAICKTLDGVVVGRLLASELLSYMYCVCLFFL